MESKPKSRISNGSGGRKNSILMPNQNFPKMLISFNSTEFSETFTVISWVERNHNLPNNMFILVF